MRITKLLNWPLCHLLSQCLVSSLGVPLLHHSLITILWVPITYVGGLLCFSVAKSGEKLNCSSGASQLCAQVEWGGDWVRSARFSGSGSRIEHTILHRVCQTYGGWLCNSYTWRKLALSIFSSITGQIGIKIDIEILVYTFSMYRIIFNHI